MGQMGQDTHHAIALAIWLLKRPYFVTELQESYVHYCKFPYLTLAGDMSIVFIGMSQMGQDTHYSIALTIWLFKRHYFVTELQERYVHYCKFPYLTSAGDT